MTQRYVARPRWGGTRIRRPAEFVIALALALECGFAASAQPAPGKIDNSGANVIRNGSFGAGLEHWTVPRPSSGRIGAGGCPDSQCLQLHSTNGSVASVGQSIRGLTPGRRYVVEAQVHASMRQRVRLSLHDSDWKGPHCARKPLSVFVETVGTDDWQTLRTLFRIPKRDPCSSTRDHAWRLEVEFTADRGARPGVMLNDLGIFPLDEEADFAGANSRPACAYFRDFENLDPCPDPEPHFAARVGEHRLVTVGKWMLDEGWGRLIHDYVAGRNGLVESSIADKDPDWREGALLFSGLERVRIDSGQPIAGDTFELSLEVLPDRDFAAGCLLASQPEGSHLGGFRLCVSQTTQVLSFEMSDGKVRREYASFMPSPLETERFTTIRIRGRKGVLEVFVAGQRVEQFEVARLRLTRSPYELVIGAGVKKSEPGFRGRIRNVTLRDASPVTGRASSTPLGFVSRGSWSLDEGAGNVVRDSATHHHGLFENTHKRRPPTWHGDVLHFEGVPEAGGVMVRDAGPLYGDDFEIRLEAMFDKPRSDWGSLLLTNTGSAVKGGFSISYRGHAGELHVKLADGERQIEARIALPFVIAEQEWVPIVLRFVHEQLSVSVSGIAIEPVDFPNFKLAEAKLPMLIGAYYYPPGKGLKGSIRNVTLLMRSESIVATEGKVSSKASAKAEVPCRAKPLRDTMIVGHNRLVPNWLGATCRRPIRGDARFEYVVELPRDFELLASGASLVQGGKVVQNKIEKLASGMRNGEKTRRYRVLLSYRSSVTGASAFGPLFIRGGGRSDAQRSSEALPRMYFQEATRVDLEEPSSVALLTKEFPQLPTAVKLHHSLAWMELHNSMSWPDFLKNYGGLGFNAVPTLVLYDHLIEQRARRKFLKAARRKGFDLLVVDSPYHAMISSAAARVKNPDGVVRRFIDPSYRGDAYWAELDRIAADNLEVKPDYYMMDIECFVDGAYACLIGTASACSHYLASDARNPTTDVSGAVTDLGVELIANIRHEINRVLPPGEAPLMGLYNSRPNQIYTRIFDFDKLYDHVVDYAQPVLYGQPPGKVGAALRDIRAQMPNGAMIPWLDPGSVVEVPSIWIYDRVLEVFGAGASGIAWFSYKLFEGADFYHLARAMEAVIPVEEVIVGSEPMAAITVEAGGVSATGLSKGPHHLLLLSHYGEEGEETEATAGTRVAATGEKGQFVALQLPIDVQGTLWDLARKQPLGVVDGRELKIDWRPGIAGARSALYYLGPASLSDGRFKLD